MSPFPKCPVCKNPHASGVAHIWDDEQELAKQELVDFGQIFQPDTYEGANPLIKDTPVAQGIERLTTNQGAGGSSPSGCTNAEETILREALGPAYPKPSFDRTTYQRDYMRDLPKARAEGLTVKVWRQKHGKE